MRRSRPEARRSAKYERSKARRAVSVIEEKRLDEISATDVLNFVASIFARGDAKERK